MKKAIVLIFIASIILSGCNKEHTLELNNTKIDVNSNINSCTLIKSVDGVDVGEDAVLEDGKITTSNAIIQCTPIDTTVLGEQEVVYTIDDQMIAFQVEVVDDVAPEITIDDEYTIAKGYELDILDMTQIEDNLDEYADLDISIDGEVDTSKAGDYSIIITVKDKAGNIASKDVLFKIVDGDIDESSNSIEHSISGDLYENKYYKGAGYQIITSEDSDVTITNNDGSLSIVIK